MNRKKISGACVLFIILFSSTVFSYKQGPNVTGIDDPNTYVHQKITKEAEKVWSLIPYEIKKHLTNNIAADPNGEISFEGLTSCILNGADYDIGDDIVTGSGEEDNARSTCEATFGNHFWQPDRPDTLTIGNDDYDDGLGPFGSSYRKSVEYWTMNIIPNYLSGNTNISYYWLGRVAHLLEDATQPSHVLLDPHSGHFGSIGDGTSTLENHTGINVDTYNGNNLNHYNYGNLIEGFNWSSVEPTRAPDRWNIELFRLFWYTAQKTQYFASDDREQNFTYTKLDGSKGDWQCSGTSSLNLWRNESLTSCSNFTTQSQLPSNVAQEANATIPHSMKSVAGLYRLFWDAVQVDWKHNHHDIRNTGYTLLKGDITSNNKQIWNFSSAPSTDFWDEVAIAEIDNNVSDGQEIIVTTSNADFTDGRVYALDGDTNNVLWTFNDPNASEHPSVDDADGDGIKEVVFGSKDLFLYSISSKNGSLNWKYRMNNHVKADSPHGNTIADINNDGGKEIIFGEIGEDGTFNGRTVSLKANGSLFWNSSTTAVQGFQSVPAIADLNGDGFPEVIMTAGDGVYVYNGTNGVELCRKHMANVYASAVIADLDNDNDYEIIIGTSKNTVSGEICSSGTCYSAINVLDNNCNILWNGSVDYHVIATPAVANLDDDSNLEIVVATALTPDFTNIRNTSFNNGSVYVFDGVTKNMDWNSKFVAGAKIQSSPAIADIDNDGILEILIGAYDGKLYVLNQSKGNEWNYSFSSYLIANPAIGDIDGDKVAEIVVKHASHLGPHAKSKYGGGGLMFTNQTYKETYKERLEKISKIQQSKINRKTFDVLTKLNDEAEEEFIIKFKDNVKNLPNIEKRKEIKNKTIMLAKGQVGDIRTLLARNDVDYIEYNDKINLNSDFIPDNVYKTNAPNVWNNTNGSGIKIAIVDSGISQHDDLSIAGGVSFISENYSDNNGHGTAVSGIVSALLNNNGIVGISPSAEIYAVKIFENNEGNLYDAVEAIEWAIDNKMDIIIMSWGLNSYSKILEDSLYKAYQNGILLIASTGNDGENKILYPAHYPQVIAVGAIDKNNNRASFSNYGNKLELVVPGVDINSTSLGNSYSVYSGTSMATPHIAGISALIKSYQPNLTNCYIREVLRKSAIDLGKTGFDEDYGYGLGIINLNIINNMDLSSINCSIQREIKDITQEPEDIFLLAAEPSTLETLGGTNRKPQIVNLSNYTVYTTGDLITLKVEAIDPDNNTLTYYYISPFNSSGQWKTNENSSGNYTIFVQVSDGNLTDEGYINFTVAVASLEIESINSMYSNATLKIFEFVILNDGDTAVTDVEWHFDTNDSSIINSTSNLSSLAAGEKAFVYVQHNFSTTGSYNIRANASGISSSTLIGASLSSSIGVGDIAITSFDDVNVNVGNVIFEIQARNNLETNITNINWSLATGDGVIINSLQQFASIRPNETVFVYVNYDYGTGGTFNPTATATNITYSDSKTIALDIRHLESLNLTVANESSNKRIFEYIIKNFLSFNLTNVSWDIDTKNGYVINSTETALIQPSEQIFVYIDYNYTTTGTYNVNATAANNTLRDSINLTITI
ncbi:S8 family serine peptidase [Candidatus Woesearchaeota archaeon]|nr:S8 family serine peptidase [Candidatus Woesearchaeota archaeon]